MFHDPNPFKILARPSPCKPEHILARSPHMTFYQSRSRQHRRQAAPDVTLAKASLQNSSLSLYGTFSEPLPNISSPSRFRRFPLQAAPKDRLASLSPKTFSPGRSKSSPGNSQGSSRSRRHLRQAASPHRRTRPPPKMSSPLKNTQRKELLVASLRWLRMVCCKSRNEIVLSFHQCQQMPTNLIAVCVL